MKHKITNILIFITLLLGMSIFSYIPLELFNIDFNNLSSKLQILYTFTCDIGFMLIIYVLYHKSINKDIKDMKINYKSYIELTIKYYIIGLIIMYASNIIINLLFDKAIANNEEMVRDLINKYPLYMLFSVSIYAPFVEEIIFRKSIKDAVLSYGNNHITKYLYIITSGLIFSLLHVLGSDNIIDYLYIIPYLSLGCIFALIYYKTDNIFNTIIIHSLHNTVAIILYLVAGV